MTLFFMRYPVVVTVVLLVFSNIFMTIAWYGHLKYAKIPLAAAIFASWGLALFEYTFQVPANRIGYGPLSLMQLKILQEIITLTVFSGFAFFAFGQTLKWNYAVSFLFVVGAVYFAFRA